MASLRPYGPHDRATAGRVNIEELSRGTDASGREVCSYRCRERDCEWAADGVSRGCAETHARTVHPEGGGCHVFKPLSAEEMESRQARKREKAAARSRRYRSSKKQKQQVSSDVDSWFTPVR